MRINKKVIKRRISQKNNMGLVRNERDRLRNPQPRGMSQKKVKVNIASIKSNIKLVDNDTTNNGKALKVICCYFGERRIVANTPENITDFLKLTIQNEIDIENGMKTDVLIVNNDAGELKKNKWLFDTYNNKKTKNGKIIVDTRPNNGGSFGAYYYSFLNYWKQYDYWFFCEDDVLIFKENYMLDFANLIDINDNVSFISLAPIRESIIPTHSGGGCGLTSTNLFLRQHDLRKLKKFYDKLDTDLGYGDLEQLEINFTNNFVNEEYHLTNHPKYSIYPKNYEKNKLYENFPITNNNLEHIYNIGF